MAGVPMPVMSQEARAEERERASLKEVMGLAAGLFERCLNDAPGARARTYLTTRGLDAAAQREFASDSRRAENFALRDASLQRESARPDDRGRIC